MAARALLSGDSNTMAKMAAERLEWRRRNGGNGKGGGESDGSGAGFAWR